MEPATLNTILAKAMQAGAGRGLGGLAAQRLWGSAAARRGAATGGGAAPAEVHCNAQLRTRCAGTRTCPSSIPCNRHRTQAWKAAEAAKKARELVRRKSVLVKSTLPGERRPVCSLLAACVCWQVEGVAGRGGQHARFARGPPRASAGCPACRAVPALPSAGAPHAPASPAAPAPLSSRAPCRLALAPQASWRTARPRAATSARSSWWRGTPRVGGRAGRWVGCNGNGARLPRVCARMVCARLPACAVPPVRPGPCLHPSALRGPAGGHSSGAALRLQQRGRQHAHI